MKFYLRPLLAFAAEQIPVDEQPSTPIYLYATAGMRLIPPETRNKILYNSCELVRQEYKFNTELGCENHFKVISGVTEGILGWVTLNYLKDRISNKDTVGDVPSTLGFLEMGGASTQIAFEPTKQMSEIHSNDLQTVSFKFLDGTHKDYHIFVYSFLGFGANEAYRRYKTHLTEKENSSSLVISDPCLHSGYSKIEDRISPAGIPTTIKYTGSGDFNGCVNFVNPIINKTACAEEPCLFNGVHAPLLDIRNHHFVGVSGTKFLNPYPEFWYTVFDIYKLGGAYNYEDLLSAATKFCSTPWNVLVEQKLGSAERLESQCFKTAFIMNVLHTGLGLPYKSKSLYESVDEFEEFGGFSWTLGAILIYASSTISSSSARFWTYISSLFLGLFCLIIVAFIIFILIRKRSSLFEKFKNGYREVGGLFIDKDR